MMRWPDGYIDLFRPVLGLPCQDCGRRVGFRIDGLCVRCRGEERAQQQGAGRAVPTARQVVEERRRALDAFKAARPSTRPPAENELSPGMRLVYAELRGARDGRQYAGDPWAAARADGVPIVRVDAGVLARSAGRPITGRYLPPKAFGPLIQLAAGLDAATEQLTLVHELAHYFGIIDDDAAEAYAVAFVAQKPKAELPGEAWRRLCGVR
jgi:hypothetical protein